MTMLETYRSQLKRAEDELTRDQKKADSLSNDLEKKRGELSKATNATRQRSIARQIESLSSQFQRATKTVSTRRDKVARLRERVRSAEETERKEAERKQKRVDAQSTRAQQAIERNVASVSAGVNALHSRLSEIESALLDQVRDAVAADETSRQHDIYLVFASPDETLAAELDGELRSENLDVWFSRRNIALGKPQMRQMDRGIASSRIGVVLITKEFLEGRYWSEREIGALLSVHRNVIPVLHGVKFRELGEYSPFLSDLAGLEVSDMQGFSEIAALIAETLAGED